MDNDDNENKSFLIFFKEKFFIVYYRKFISKKKITKRQIFRFRKLVGWTPSSKMPDIYVHMYIDHIVRSLRKRSCASGETTN